MRVVTIIPEGYMRCPKNKMIYTFPPFVKWLKMINKERMDYLLDDAKELLTANAKR